ncbi:MAG: SDR family NAD(P)-dependent oxidoreductase, partial [Flavisolibacter sp.]
MKIVLITGATSGFGEATARKFAQEGFDILINGRRAERLEKLKNELEGQYKIKCQLIPFDVRVKEDVFNSINNLPEEWKNI